jgi:hypothetical protein
MIPIIKAHNNDLILTIHKMIYQAKYNLHTIIKLIILLVPIKYHFWESSYNLYLQKLAIQMLNYLFI